MQYFFMRRQADGRLFRTAYKYSSLPRRMRPKRPVAEDEVITEEDLTPIYIAASDGTMLAGNEFTWARPTESERKALAGDSVVAR